MEELILKGSSMWGFDSSLMKAEEQSHVKRREWEENVAVMF